jgi:hypothetical protein
LIFADLTRPVVSLRSTTGYRISSLRDDHDMSLPVAA